MERWYSGARRETWDTYVEDAGAATREESVGRDQDRLTNCIAGEEEVEGSLQLYRQLL